MIKTKSTAIQKQHSEVLRTNSRNLQTIKWLSLGNFPIYQSLARKTSMRNYSEALCHMEWITPRWGKSLKGTTSNPLLFLRKDLFMHELRGERMILTLHIKPRLESEYKQVLKGLCWWRVWQQQLSLVWALGLLWPRKFWFLFPH